MSTDSLPPPAARFFSLNIDHSAIQTMAFCTLGFVEVFAYLGRIFGLALSIDGSGNIYLALADKHNQVQSLKIGKKG